MYIEYHALFNYPTDSSCPFGLSAQTTLKKLKISFGWQVLLLENLENAARTIHVFRLRLAGSVGSVVLGLSTINGNHQW